MMMRSVINGDVCVHNDLPVCVCVCVKTSQEKTKKLRNTRQQSAALGQTELENGPTETGASRQDWNTHPLTFIYMSCIYINGVVPVLGWWHWWQRCRDMRRQWAATPTPPPVGVVAGWQISFFFNTNALFTHFDFYY